MKNIKYPVLAGEMIKHNESYETLAKLLGVARNSVWRRFTGRTPWTISDVDKLCEHYGKDYYELFKNKVD